MYKCNKMFSCYFRCYKRCSHTWESRFIMHAVLESRCKTNVMSHRHAVFPKAHSSLFSVPVKEITFPQSKENINPDCERTMTHCWLLEIWGLNQHTYPQLILRVSASLFKVYPQWTVFFVCKCLALFPPLSLAIITTVTVFS